MSWALLAATPAFRWFPRCLTAQDKSDSSCSQKKKKTDTPPALTATLAKAQEEEEANTDSGVQLAGVGGNSIV